MSEQLKPCHELKAWPCYFQPLWTGKKSFELRVNDRNFQVGDKLLIREFDPDTSVYTGMEFETEITYVLESPRWLRKGVCALGFCNFRRKDLTRPPQNSGAGDEEELASIIYANIQHDHGYPYAKSVARAILDSGFSRGLRAVSMAEGWAIVKDETNEICGHGMRAYEVFLEKEQADKANTYPAHGYKGYSVKKVYIVATPQPERPNFQEIRSLLQPLPLAPPQKENPSVGFMGETL